MTQPNLHAGVATADITPPVGIAHAGWGAQTHERAAGVDMPFTVTALSLRKGDTAAMVLDLDLGTISVADADRIRSEVQDAVETPAANVRVSYSHTHAGAVMSSFGAYIEAGQELIEGYRETLVQQCIAAARDAVAVEVPSRVVAGEGRSDVAVNRRLLVDEPAIAPHVVGEVALPTARRLCDEVLSLPLHPHLTDGEVDRVVASVRSWVNRP